MTDKKAIEHAKAIVEYCHKQRGCQNCIFRRYGAENWDCHINGLRLDDVIANVEAKKKNHGYIDK